MRRFLLFFICLLGVTAVFGQYNSNKNRFEVDEKKGCAPFTVNLTDHGFCGGTCQMTLGDGRSSTISGGVIPPATYTNPGNYTIVIQAQSQLDPLDTIQITVVENIEPTFEVYTCTDNKVSVRVTDKSFDTYFIDFDGDGTPDTTVPMGNNAIAQFDYATTAFPAPHTFNIGVRGKNVNAADNCKTPTEAFTTLPTGATIPPPTINSMSALDPNTLSMTLGTADQILYRLEIAPNGSGAFQNYTDLYEKTSIDIPSLLVDANYYCFRLNSVDPCAGTSAPSPVICSQNFDVTYVNGSNNLIWDTQTGGVTSWEIIRNKASYLANYPGNSLGFEDKDYDCNQQYCYTIIAHYGPTVTSTSLEKCGIGILQTTYPPITNITSVVRDDVTLTWTADETIKIAAFDVNKSLDGAAITPFRQTNASPFVDETYNKFQGACYQVNYGDACNNRSEPGIIACPMVLGGVIDEKNVVTLNWNAYNGYKDGISEYVVYKYDQLGVELTKFTTTDITYIDNDPSSPDQINQYRIRAISNEPGIDDSWSNPIIIEKPVRLILPNAFTPNGDGVNPTFTIAGKYVSKITLQIFDRWGVLVFSSDKNEPWDGTKGGKPMPESAYIWKAEVEDFAGNSFTQQGTVLLLRPRN